MRVHVCNGTHEPDTLLSCCVVDRITFAHIQQDVILPLRINQMHCPIAHIRSKAF